jgi:hypothetical protein
MYVLVAIFKSQFSGAGGDGTCLKRLEAAMVLA